MYVHAGVVVVGVCKCTCMQAFILMFVYLGVHANVRVGRVLVIVRVCGDSR